MYERKGRNKKKNVPVNSAVRKMLLEKRKADISRLLVQGYNYTEIAKRVGVNFTTVSKQVSELREEWERQSNEDYKYLQERELRDLNLQESELWDAWEKSKTRFVETTREESTRRA